MLTPTLSVRPQRRSSCSSYDVRIVEPKPGTKVYAVCRCGWRSPALQGGGLAGAAWDDHLVQQTGRR